MSDSLMRPDTKRDRTRDSVAESATVLVHHNDVASSIDVRLLLQTVFELSSELAEHIALEAHRTGTAPIITRTQSEAKRLSNTAQITARQWGLTLNFSLEKEMCVFDNLATDSASARPTPGYGVQSRQSGRIAVPAGGTRGQNRSVLRRRESARDRRKTVVQCALISILLMCAVGVAIADRDVSVFPQDSTPGSLPGTGRGSFALVDQITSLRFCITASKTNMTATRPSCTPMLVVASPFSTSP